MVARNWDALRRLGKQIIKDSNFDSYRQRVTQNPTFRSLRDDPVNPKTFILSGIVSNILIHVYLETRD